MALTAEQQGEIEAARAAEGRTRRPVVPALEAMLFEAIPVLDHGFVRVIDYMGDDAAVVQAAACPTAAAPGRPTRTGA
jgi:thymidylate synthase (FAD)